MPKVGCRTIGLTFNRLHAAKSKQPMSIGKTYVAEVLKRGQKEVMQARRQMRRRKPRATERNRTWALDLTYAGQAGGSPLPLLGVLDHGTRACLALQALERNAALGATELRAFRLWYNHLRPHQSLEGLTLSEVWSDQSESTRVGKAVRFEFWGGVLSGFYVPD